MLLHQTKSELAVPPVRVLPLQGHPTPFINSACFSRRSQEHPLLLKYFTFGLLDKLLFVYILRRADALRALRQLTMYDVPRISTGNDLKSRPLLDRFSIRADQVPKTSTSHPCSWSAWSGSGGRAAVVHMPCPVAVQRRLHPPASDPTMQLVSPKYRQDRWDDNWTITNPARTEWLTSSDKDADYAAFVHGFATMRRSRGSVDQLAAFHRPPQSFNRSSRRKTAHLDVPGLRSNNNNASPHRAVC